MTIKNICFVLKIAQNELFIQIVLLKIKLYKIDLIFLALFMKAKGVQITILDFYVQSVSWFMNTY